MSGADAAAPSDGSGRGGSAPTLGSRLGALLVGVGFVLVALLAVAPMLWPGRSVSVATSFVFSGLCHRDPARSFALDGHAMAVCHRCAGIYGGLALGGFAAALARVDPRRRALYGIGVAPLAAQVVLAWIWPPLDQWWLRVATGAIAGAVGGLLLGSTLRR